MNGPSYDCLRRTAARIDAEELDKVFGSWALALVAGRPGGGPVVLAADGKGLRGAKNGGGQVTRLLAACDHATGIVVGPVEVGAKTNEIPKVKDLLDQIGDVSGVVFTLDALHTQDKTAELIVSRGADYLFTVKASQPGLLASCLAHPWNRADSHTTAIKGHGRVSTWTAKTQTPSRWVRFPGVAQVAQVVRRRKTARGESIETCHMVTSVGPGRAGPAQIAASAQGHWSIENRIHWVRDVTYDEDRSQLRRGNAPRVMAAIRNTAIALIRATGATSIAQSQRHLAHRYDTITQLIGLC
ncbi:MAG: ISAs1 family transposase [Bifidobacteriaceae bacterium]|nr:ISAs1 family transposase [Bifidobacteriaceae bacterium]